MRQSSTSNGRYQLEQELLGRLKAAEAAYRASAAEYQKVRLEYGSMLDHPDGALALHKAATHERQALQEYSKALSDFTELTVYGRSPEPPADPE